MKKIIGLILIGLLGICITTNAQRGKYATVASNTIMKNTTNEVIDSSYVVFYTGDYDHFAADIKMAGGVTVSAFCTNDESLSDADTTGWVDFNDAMFPDLTLTDSHIMSYAGIVFSPLKVMLYFKNSDNTNSCKVIVRRY